MFKCVLHSDNDGWRCELDGCPKNGLGAIDFRRKWGLPDAPSAVITLPSYTWEDEEFVREAAALAEYLVNDRADVISVERAGCQYSYWTSAGRVNRGDSRNFCERYRPVILPPAVALAFLAGPSPAAGRDVFRALWARGREDLCRALAECHDLADPEGRAMAAQDVARLGEPADVLAQACAFADRLLEGAA
jgi:hypothetical protein